MMRKISDSKAKWKLGLKKLRRQSTISEPSIGESSVMEEETTEGEVQDYFTKLKKKTGLNQLWSGRKFSEAIDKDPDIDLSEEPRLRSSTLRQLTLDSDEEDLHDFIHNLSDYEKSAITEIEEGTSRPSSTPSDIDVMKNINFAEVGASDHNLLDSVGSNNDDDKDFMPLVIRPEFDIAGGDLDNTESSQSNIFKTANINFVASDVSSVEVLPDGDKSINEEVVSESDENISELAEESLEVNYESRAKTPATPVKSHDYTTSKFESYESGERSESVISTDAHTSEHIAKKVGRHRGYAKKAGDTYSKLSDNERYRKSKRKNAKDSKNTNGSIPSRTGSSKSREDSSCISDSSFSSTSVSSKSSSISKRKSTHSEKHVKKQDASHKMNKRADRKASTKGRSKNLKVSLNDLGTVNTELFLNDNITSKYLDPSPIATTVIDHDALEAVTSYNPTMLALNDLLKYQIQLTRQYIDNSWRLYKAYAEPEVKGTHRYTTLKDTMKYLKKNAPSVISYEEALSHVKENE